MTFAIGHVEGGTDAGRKRPLRDKPAPWQCKCVYFSRDPGGEGTNGYEQRPGYQLECWVCGEKRP